MGTSVEEGAIESGNQYQIEVLLANIINHLESRIANKFEANISDWEKRCAHLNQEVTFRSGNQKVKGRFNRLSSTGQAIIITDSAKIKYDSGEIIL